MVACMFHIVQSGSTLAVAWPQTKAAQSHLDNNSSSPPTRAAPLLIEAARRFGYNCNRILRKGIGDRMVPIWARLYGFALSTRV